MDWKDNRFNSYFFFIGWNSYNIFTCHSFII